MSIGSYQDNLHIVLLLAFVALAIAVLMFFVFKKRILPAVFVMSVLSNIIFYVDVSSPIYSKFFKIFTLSYWPWINVLLLAYLIAMPVIKKLKSK